eukprot:COSAG01_NODE_8963_length_2601_cov_1.907274_4_plen_196_part_00
MDGFADGGRESPHAQPEALLLTDSINAPWVCGCGWVYLWLVVRAINRHRGVGSGGELRYALSTGTGAWAREPAHRGRGGAGVGARTHAFFTQRTPTRAPARTGSPGRVEWQGCVTGALARFARVWGCFLASIGALWLVSGSHGDSVIDRRGWLAGWLVGARHAAGGAHGPDGERRGVALLPETGLRPRPDLAGAV